MHACRSTLEDPTQDLAPWSADTQKAAREAVARAMKGDLPPEQASTVMGLAFAVPGGSLRTADLVDLYVESAPAAHLGQYRRQLVERIVMMTRVRGGGPGPELWSVAESGAARLLDQPGALAQWLGFFGTTGFQFPGAWAVAARAKGPEARRLAYEGICAVAGTDAAVREAALPFLGEDLRSPDLEMQKLAVRVAGALPAPGHAESLRALRSTAREEERSRILEVLVACAGMGALQEVREDLASTDEALRRTALRMLVNELRVRDPAELVGYVDRGGDPYHIVELAEYDHPPEAAFLRPFILALPPEKYTEDFIYGAAAILEGAERVRLLETAMSSRDPEVVERAVERAGELRVLGLWPRLLGMMEEGNGGVREAAERALQNLQKYAETKASLARFGKDDQAAAIRDAERLLQSNDPAKRRGAALALGALGDRGAIAALLRLLDDKEAAVRDAALGALERLGGGKAEAPK